MNAVRDLQDQIREQDEAQSKMTRSTRCANRIRTHAPVVSLMSVAGPNSRSGSSWLLYFTLIEAVVLFGVTAWQNLYLKSFFEVKRVV